MDKTMSMAHHTCIINDVKYKISEYDVSVIDSCKYGYGEKDRLVLSDEAVNPSDTQPPNISKEDESNATIIDVKNNMKNYNKLDRLTHMECYEHIETGNFFISRFRVNCMRPTVKSFYNDVKSMKYFEWYEMVEYYTNKYDITPFEFMSIRQYVYNEKIKRTETKKPYFMSAVTRFTIDDVLHRERGPAYIENSGEISVYFKEGLIHSYNDKPAFVVDSCGQYIWANRGKLDRKINPIVCDMYGQVIKVNDVKYYVTHEGVYSLYEDSDILKYDFIL
jgi:hypothetical protein